MTSAIQHVTQGLRRRMSRIPAAAVQVGLPARWLGYRWVAEDDVFGYFERATGAAATYETIHPRAVAKNPLPMNVEHRDSLPDDRGWWGYSFHDVPERVSHETVLAELPSCRILSYVDEKKGNYYPAVLTAEDRALYLREIKFRPRHGRLLRTGRTPAREKRATWILERVFDNHSHWLTAHLPKLCLLEARGALEDVILPQKRSRVMDATLRMMGLEPTDFRTFDPERPLEVDELTVLSTDRFRPELLRPARSRLARLRSPTRRIFISRARAPRRRLVNEDEIWPMFEQAGFERVRMEDLDFEAQVELMGEAAVLAAPHGAGLTNMMFCGPGTHVIEIADLSFPNPNFYAVACAMEHPYWLVRASGLGDVHPLEKDLHVEPERVRAVLRALDG